VIPRKRVRFENEAELALAVVSWLEEHDWEVFKEVVIPGGIADIVAKQDNIIWIVETKKTVSMKVFEQAHSRLHYAHYISVAVPERDNYPLFPEMASWYCNYFGIGVITVSKPFKVAGRKIPPHVIERIKPRVSRIKSAKPHLVKIRKVRDFLCDLHKEQEAGSVTSYVVTPYKKTIIGVKEFLRHNGPATMKTIIEKVHHHYKSPASARSSLKKALEFWEPDFFKFKKDGKVYYTVRDQK